MFRYLNFFAFIALFSALSAAETSGDSSARSVVDNPNSHSEIRAGTRLAPGAGARISVVRLREPRKAQRLYNKALKSWGDQEPAEAEHWLDRALKIYSPFPEALSLRGGIQASLGQWTAAEQSLRAAIQVDPNYSPAYVVLAGVYNAQARFDDAQKATDQALSAGADNWDVQYEIARSLIGKEQYKSALAVTETALRSNRHGSLLHLAKAHALLGLLEYRQAANELRAYLRYQASGDGSQHAHALLDRLQSTAGE